MPKLNKQQVIYILASAAVLIALLVSYKALVGLALLFFATPPQDKRRAAIKEQIISARQDAKEQARAEQATQVKKTEAGNRASQKVNSFIDKEW